MAQRDENVSAPWALLRLKRPFSCGPSGSTAEDNKAEVGGLGLLDKPFKKYTYCKGGCMQAYTSEQKCLRPHKDYKRQIPKLWLGFELLPS